MQIKPTMDPNEFLLWFLMTILIMGGCACVITIAHDIAYTQKANWYINQTKNINEHKSEDDILKYMENSLNTP